MTKKLTAIRGSFTEKVKVLEKAKTQLKKEFVGIDEIIDELVDNVRSWYTMNSVQEKPAVINLWGLTGVGKTSVVLRLMELIGYSDKTFRIDLGENQGHMSFRSTMGDLCENREDDTVVIMLDEFQHAKTVSGPFRMETDKDENRKVWELIDSGKFTFSSWKRGIFQFEDLISKLKRLLAVGVRVENGVVVEGSKLFLSEIDDYYEEDKPIYFYPRGDYQLLIDLAGKELGLELHSDLKEILLTKDSDETIQFLEKALRIAKQPHIKSFQKALIFVLGNIDEAYTMSGNYSADVSADEFHRLSKRITVPEMKKALRERFRDEQIARLGNIHIIYPALGEDSYRKIIRLELEKVNSRVQELSGLRLTYEDSLVEGIYQEGVYPTQGARPVFTTIHQMVKSKLSIYLHHILLKNIKADTLHLSIDKETLTCSIRSRGKEKSVLEEKVVSKLRKLRKPRRDERQAIAAVHEAGHTVLNIALFNKIPELVVSVTTDVDADGFMYSRNNKYYLSKHEIVPRAAMLLGGITAEELVFGKDHITTGSSSDIATATSMITSVLKKQGFGKTRLAIADSTTEETRFYHRNEEVEEQVRELIEEAQIVAQNVLRKEKTLLLELSNFLSKHPRIEKNEILKMCRKHLITPLNTGRNQRYYRNKLNSALRSNRKSSVEDNSFATLENVAKRR